MTTFFRPLAAVVLLGSGGFALAAGPACQAESGATLTPVIELYTSEGCSSCPPADRWLSTFKRSAASGTAVVQAFHVGYWDNLGWVDRFARPEHTVRQKQVAAVNRLSNVYTPQRVRNGRDWPGDPLAATPNEPARARWSAYWTVTEHGHSSKVKAGENAGELLQHDFVVRQYVPAGDYQGPARLLFRAVPGEAGHARQVNLVVFDKASGKPLQALSLGC